MQEIKKRIVRVPIEKQIKYKLNLLNFTQRQQTSERENKHTNIIN